MVIRPQTTLPVDHTKIINISIAGQQFVIAEEQCTIKVGQINTLTTREAERLLTPLGLCSKTLSSCLTFRALCPACVYLVAKHLTDVLK